MTGRGWLEDKYNQIKPTHCARHISSALFEKSKEVIFMKAIKTFYIGLAVALLCTVQFILSHSPVRLIGMAVGIFFIFFGWKIGWTRNRNLTTLLGHLAVASGCLVSAYAIYQIPFLKMPPTIIGVIDMPLFWGLFTIFGGYCMITHGYCSCTIKMHEDCNHLKIGAK
jgi:hypothetical protein